MKEEELVDLVQTGDKEAFNRLVAPHYAKIVSLAERFVGHADSEDVAQEAIVRAWKALPRFKGNSAFYTWLYRIAVNTSKNWLVSRSRRDCFNHFQLEEEENHSHTESYDKLQDRCTPEDLVMSEELESRIQKALEGLQKDLRTAISLREFDGMSYEEIADAMGCPIGTVRSRIFRARAAINDCLEK